MTTATPTRPRSPRPGHAAKARNNVPISVSTSTGMQVALNANTSPSEILKNKTTKDNVSLLDSLNSMINVIYGMSLKDIASGQVEAHWRDMRAYFTPTLGKSLPIHILFEYILTFPKEQKQKVINALYQNLNEAERRALFIGNPNASKLYYDLLSLIKETRARGALMKASNVIEFIGAKKEDLSHSSSPVETAVTTVVSSNSASAVNFIPMLERAPSPVGQSVGSVNEVANRLMARALKRVFQNISTEIIREPLSAQLIKTSDTPVSSVQSIIDSMDNFPTEIGLGSEYPVFSIAHPSILNAAINYVRKYGGDGDNEASEQEILDKTEDLASSIQSMTNLPLDKKAQFFASLSPEEKKSLQGCFTEEAKAKIRDNPQIFFGFIQVVSEVPTTAKTPISENEGAVGLCSQYKGLAKRSQKLALLKKVSQGVLAEFFVQLAEADPKEFLKLIKDNASMKVVGLGLEFSHLNRAAEKLLTHTTKEAKDALMRMFDNKSHKLFGFSTGFDFRAPLRNSDDFSRRNLYSSLQSKLPSRGNPWILEAGLALKIPDCQKEALAMLTKDLGLPSSASYENIGKATGVSSPPPPYSAGISVVTSASTSVEHTQGQPPQSLPLSPKL
ncbi:MAG: hypothetical protein WCW01_04085 [Gammaproteobacteria bacterium]